MNTEEMIAVIENTPMELEKNWGAEPWREPKTQEGDAVVLSECGRITHNIDYRSHWFVMVRNHNVYYLLVSHGGGEERIQMPFVNFTVTVNAISCLDSSEARYLVLHTLYDIHRNAKSIAEAATAAKYRQAFADGKLKKRKLPGQARVKVWIEN